MGLRPQQNCFASLRTFFALVLVLTLAGLSGCVTRTVDARGQVVTRSETKAPSDESETHKRSRIRLELASNYFEAGQTNVALDEVRQALAIDANNPDAHNLRGLIYLQLNVHAQAEESFRRALALRPQDASIVHNHAWLLCQQKHYAEADKQFERALSSPAYAARSKTLMAQGLCQERAGQGIQAEATLLKAYELDARNPIIAYNLSSLLSQRGQNQRAQFYIRRLNNSEWANAESLWLGIKIERALGDSVALEQLAGQLGKRFPESREQSWYEQGIFNE